MSGQHLPSLPPTEPVLPIVPSAATLPRENTLPESDWRILARYWYPVAFSHEVTNQPHAARLLDERLVLWRLSDGSLSAAKDLCFHRGAPMSLGRIEGDNIVCAYHGLRYDASGRCVCIPAHPNGTISPRLRLQTYPVREACGLIWVRLTELSETAPDNFPEMLPEWTGPGYIQILPPSVSMNAAAGRQIEGFLDVSHFSFVHTTSFGEAGNPEVPSYPVTPTATGFVADYISTVSNYGHGQKYLNPPGFLWHRRFEVYYPFTAKLTVIYPNEQRLHARPPQRRLPCLRAQTAPLRAHLPELRHGRAAPANHRFPTCRFSPKIRPSSSSNGPKTCLSTSTLKRTSPPTAAASPTAKG